MSSTDHYSSKKTYEIPLLKDDGSNYNAWKFRQTTVLRLRGLLGIVNGTDMLPDPLTGADAKDVAKIKTYDNEVTKWKKRDEDAFAQVTLNMEDGAMADVMETTSAFEAWT
ncbi:hypothetical protein FRC08_001748 [Ceratobasidium sp. 394]|nr:hypothetical protein FRC08_001748 [Ceratobasidium sp. 394]